MSTALKAGAVLDERFELLRRLGAGSTGAVWEAQDRHDGRRVACKILHPQLSDDRQVVAQMEREAQVLQELDHPGLTRPIHFSTSGPLVFLAMELVDGEPLSELLGGRAKTGHLLNPREIRALFEPLCGTVVYAHSKYIVHRDLKPQNVMVRAADGTLDIKVLDFGLARLLEGSIFEATTFGRALGSLFYMSPEQTRGEPATARSDVFALGAILFEIVTLRRAWARDADDRPVVAFTSAVPGAANSLAKVFDRISRADRPSARAARPEVPSALDETIRRALAIAPQDRPATVAELCATAMESIDRLDEHAEDFADPGADPFGPTTVVDPGGAPDAAHSPTAEIPARDFELMTQAATPYPTVGFPEPDLPATSRGPVRDDGPTRSVAPKGEPNLAFTEPAPLLTSSPVAATEPGDLHRRPTEDRTAPAQKTPMVMVVEAKNPPRRRGPVIERRVEPFGPTREVPAAAPERSMLRPALWGAGTALAVGLGALVGGTLFSVERPAPTPGVIAVLPDEDPAVAQLRQLLDQLQATPRDRAVHRRVHNAVLAGAAKLPEGPQREEIVGLATLSERVGNAAGLRTAARLLIEKLRR